MKKLIWFLIIAGVIIRFTVYIYSNQGYFLRKFDPVYISDLYSKSQYVLGSASIGGIGDDGLYAFAGYYYFFQKGDVSNVNFEHPPLGKYLIGLSIFLFDNENVINIIYFLLLLVLTYQIGKIVLSDNLQSVLASAILSLDPLFLDNLLRSLLDLPLTLFFIAGVYFFLKGLLDEKNLYISFFFWGAAFSTRFFPVLLIICLYLLIVIILYQRKSLITFIKASLLVPIIYLASHFSFFVYHPSVIEFLRHKKWMLSWFTGTPIIFGNIWRNILTGTYLDSTRKLAINSHWSPVLPLIVILAVSRLRKGLFNKENINLQVVYGVSTLFILYLSFLTNGLQKFVMPVYPLLIILSISNLNSLYSIINAWLKRKSLQLKAK